jgi:hypothetical protein
MSLCGPLAGKPAHNAARQRLVVLRKLLLRTFGAVDDARSSGFEVPKIATPAQRTRRGVEPGASQVARFPARLGSLDPSLDPESALRRCLLTKRPGFAGKLLLRALGAVDEGLRRFFLVDRQIGTPAPLARPGLGTSCRARRRASAPLRRAQRFESTRTGYPAI